MSKAMLTALEPNDEGHLVWQVAARTAQQHEARLTVINVVEPAVSIYADLNFTPLLECTTDWQTALKKEHRAYFERTAAKLFPGETSAPDAIQVREGNPATEITALAAEQKAELLIMGLHNRRGFSRLLGSTTHKVLNHCHCDILAVHPATNPATYRKVLIAVDTTELAGDVLASAHKFATGADFTAISVIIPLGTVFAAPEASHGLGWSFEELSKDIKQQTHQNISAQIARAGITANLLLPEGDPRDEIIRAAESMQADLIVIGNSNRGAINRLVLGSTARAVLDHTPCDVLICKS